MEDIIENEIPSDVLEEAAAATNNLFPEKTKQRYQQEYDNFKKWRQNKNIHRISEEVLLAYAKGMSETYSPTTLWTKISMLKLALRIYENIDISRTISNTFLLLYQLGICCVYTVFVAENIKNVLDQYMTNPLDERIIMLITLLPLIFINYIKNLKFLAPITTLANVLTFVSFAIIFYFIFNKKVSFDDREPIGDYRDFPLYFGTVLFALEAIGMIMPLKNEMRNPESFGSWCGVLNIGMLAVVLLYILTGFFGYLAYGKHVGGSISYTIDPENIAAQVCKLMLALAIFTTHALSMYVAIDIVWTQNLLRRFEKSTYVAIWEYAIRTALVVLTFGLAVAIPYIDLFISLVGAFCISIIGIAVPAIMDSCVQWQSHRGLKMVLIHTKNIAIILFALLGLVVGTATSLEKIIEKFGHVEGSTNSTSGST